MRVLIVCDGEPPRPALLARELDGADLIIATDGAVRWLTAAGVAPQVVIGDFDSLAETVGDWETVRAGSHDEQENSDAEKAVLLALERGATEVILVGASGRRLDHTLANAMLTARYADRADVALVDDYGECRVVSGERTVATAPGAVVSLVPLSADVHVRTSGLAWPLDEALPPGTRGLSNRATGDCFTVTVRSGLLAVVLVTE